MESLSVLFDAIKKLNESEKNEKIKKAESLLGDILEKKPCENCKNMCYTPSSCEFCMRQYLLANFRQWTSYNDKINKIIQDLQKDFQRVDHIIEWIPHDDLQILKYIPEGNDLRIDAIWEEGRFESWDFEQRKLKRIGQCQTVAMRVVDRDNKIPDQWLHEIEVNLFLSSISSPIIRSYGITKDDRTSSYMIVTEKTEYNLKTYLQSNLGKLNWVHKYKILSNILESLESIHSNKFILGNLNSGVIKYSKRREIWVISDFRFCRPSGNPMSLSVVKSSECFEIAETAAYVAPELLKSPSEPMTVNSDIYSFGMIMWEVSTGYPPFVDRPYIPEGEIIDGTRPDIMNKTPNHYSELMKQCWNKDAKKRPNLASIKNKIESILREFHSGKMSPGESDIMKKMDYQGLRLMNLKVNPGGIPVIKHDQIIYEEFFDGVGKISSARLEGKKVGIKTVQIDKNTSLLELAKKEIDDRRKTYDHPNIVEFLGIGTKNKNRLFLVIPFANDGNLRSYLKRNKLSISEKIDIAIDIAAGIMELHDNKDKTSIIHGNINPKNILMFEGKAKISNLPLLSENKELLRNVDQYIDEDILNNIGYIDPRSFSTGNNGKYNKDKSTDIYSFGILLWEIASGEVPYSKYQEGGLSKLFDAISKENHREVVIKDKDIPVGYTNLYKSCWDKDISSRPKTINDVHKQLLGIKKNKDK